MKYLVQSYAVGHSLLLEALAGLSEEELNFKPAPEKWSIKEVIIHVSDGELVAVDRMKRVIAEDNPLFFKFDPDLWSGRLHYGALDMQMHLDIFKGLRLSMVSVLNEIQTAEWDRAGVHNIAGKQTLRDIVVMFTGHIDRHILQINRNKQAYQALQ